jgi:voltage-gated potassium channel
MKTEVRNESVQYQLFMLAVSFYTLVALGIGVILRPEGEIRKVLEFSDTAICAVFLVDFVVCLYKAPNRWRYMYTWGWLDLVSSIPVVEVARWGRAARLARLLRVLRGVKATRLLGTVAVAKRTQSAFLAVALIAILLHIIASISILQVESAPESNIKTAEDALWWSLTTMTTVGYGDRYPITTEGRLIASVLMCAGVGLFGMFSGFLAAWFVSPSANRDHMEILALQEEIRQLRTMVEKAFGKAADS